MAVRGFGCRRLLDKIGLGEGVFGGSLVKIAITPVEAWSQGPWEVVGVIACLLQLCWQASCGQRANALLIADRTRRRGEADRGWERKMAEAACRSTSFSKP